MAEGIQLNVNVATVSGSTVTVTGTAPTATNDDFVKGSTGADVISTGDGNDRVWAGKGDDIIDGGAGDDVLYGEQGNDTLYGGAGNDRLFGGVDNDTLFGGIGDDWLDGGADNDRLYGDEGNDTLLGGSGNDWLSGGTGNDRLYGGTGNDILFGDEGNDLLEGQQGDDILTGGTGKDTFLYWVDNSQKSLKLGAMWGADVITDFKVGEDKLDLSTMFARFSDKTVSQIIAAATAAAADPVKSASPDKTAFATEFATLGEFTGPNLTLTGNSGDQFTFKFTYNKGDLTIVMENITDHSGAASITLKNVAVGSDFSNSFVMDTMKVFHMNQLNTTWNASDNTAALGGTGSATLKGAMVYGFDGNDVINGSDKADKLFGMNGNDKLKGGLGNDEVHGGAGNDRVDGGDGNDYLWGDAGIDELFGGNGNDQLWGGDGNDYLDAGAGDDYLNGGAGDDQLTGGAGKDIFVIQGVISAATVDWAGGKAYANFSTNGHDYILDFQQGADKVQFADWVPNGTLQSLKDANLKQQFVSDWMGKYVEFADVNNDGKTDTVVYNVDAASGLHDSAHAVLTVYSASLTSSDFLFV